jgi:hypothetical protein
MRAAAAHASTDAVDAFFREAKLRRSTNGDTTGDTTGRWRPENGAPELISGWTPEPEVSDAGAIRTSWAKD